LAPFEQRNATSLYSKLPKELVDILKPVHERGRIQNKCRRFWIQADEVERSIEETDNEVKFLFGKVKMSIRTHHMIHDSDSRLIDTSDEADKESPEALFAKGNKYLGIYLRAYRESLKERERTLLSDDNVDKIYGEMKSNMRIQIQTNLSELKRKLRNAGLNIYAKHLCDDWLKDRWNGEANLVDELIYNNLDSKTKIREMLKESVEKNLRKFEGKLN
jgi:hypothetical protein